jgi:hypothetical protein
MTRSHFTSINAPVFTCLETVMRRPDFDAPSILPGIGSMIATTTGWSAPKRGSVRRSGTARRSANRERYFNATPRHRAYICQTVSGRGPWLGAGRFKHPTRCDFELGSRCGGSRLALHLLDHLLHLFLHFLRRRLSHVGADHPNIAIRIDKVAATVAPEHVHHWSLGCGS